MPANLGVDTDITELDAATTRMRFLREAMVVLDKALRSTRNLFGSAALVDHGTTAGTVPRLGTGGKLDAGRLPASIPFARVQPAGADAKLTAAQIPAFYAKKTRGVFAAARFGGLPAWKIQSFPAGAKLSADQLPVGYSRTAWPPSVGFGGPGVTDDDGMTIGQNSAFVHQLLRAAPGQPESTTSMLETTIGADRSIRVQILTTYIRDHATPAAAAGDGGSDHPDWLNGPPANLINPPSGPDGNRAPPPS